MSCEKYLDLISARLDGELPPQEQAELDAHLQTCPACRAIAKDLEGLHTALTELGEVDAPAELSQTVLSKIKTEQQAGRRRVIRTVASLVACLALCVGVLRISDATYSDLTRGTDDNGVAQPELALAGQAAPNAARYVADDSKFKSLPLSIDAYSLSQTVIDFVPSAHLLDSADSLARFLARFPNDDLSEATDTYDEVFFLSSRLLAVVVQEPSSSITHTISELTEDSVTILRDTSVIGDTDHPRWLLLVPTHLDGPERSLAVNFTEF